MGPGYSSPVFAPTETINTEGSTIPKEFGDGT